MAESHRDAHFFFNGTEIPSPPCSTSPSPQIFRGKSLKSVFLVLQEFASPVNSPAALHLSLNFPSLQSVPPRWQNRFAFRAAFAPADEGRIPKRAGTNAGTSRGKEPSGAASERARNSEGGAQSKLGITRLSPESGGESGSARFWVGCWSRRSPWACFPLSPGASKTPQT